VNWSAISARQPDVPNLIGVAATASYSMSAAGARNAQLLSRAVVATVSAPDPEVPRLRDEIPDRPWVCC
jgi:hypothetical protein